MSGETGTFFAVGATTRALRVAPVWEKTLFNPSFSQALSKTLTNSPHFDFFSEYNLENLLDPPTIQVEYKFNNHKCSPVDLQYAVQTFIKTNGGLLSTAKSSPCQRCSAGMCHLAPSRLSWRNTNAKHADSKIHYVCHDRKSSLFSVQTHLFEKKPTDYFGGFSFCNVCRSAARLFSSISCDWCVPSPRYLPSISC